MSKWISGGTYRKTPTRATHPRRILLAVSSPSGDRSRCRSRRSSGSSGVSSAEGDRAGGVSAQRAQAVICGAGAFGQGGIGKLGGWGLEGCGGDGREEGREGEEGEEGGDHFGEVVLGWCRREVGLSLGGRWGFMSLVDAGGIIIFLC